VNILGISAFYHDSAACLVRDGEIVAAAQEERFTRVKHDARFPSRAITFCLQEARLQTARQLDQVAFYEKPILKLERLLSSYLFAAPKGLSSFRAAMSLWMTQKLWVERRIRETLSFNGRIFFPEHHESHAASAFFPSPFEEAAIITVDGVGEWATTTVGYGKANRVQLLEELHFPHSLGLLYSAFTYYLGFRVNSDEYKVMGLAPYGVPRYRDLIFSELIDLKKDGSFHLNLRYFDFIAGLTMTNSHFDELFGGTVREPETRLTQREADLARSLQTVTDEVILGLARHAREVTGATNLCLAGGVALNCVANGRLLREKIFDRIWIQPAAGDAGGALGAALTAWHHVADKPRTSTGRDRQHASLLGPAYPIEHFIDLENVPARHLSDEELFATVTELLAQGKIVAWFQGRMEFGPRALGNRSILADPRVSDMQRRLNLKVKFRESFRPFAPAVLVERVSEFFEFNQPSPYMLIVAPVKAELRTETADRESSDEDLAGRVEAVRSSIPAVTHLDYSARVQTVATEDNPRFHELLRHFAQRTGCPVLVNTSFNIRGEPPVCTPTDALQCFQRTEIDYLVIGNHLFDKSDFPAKASSVATQPGTAENHPSLSGGWRGLAANLTQKLISCLVLLGFYLVVTPLGLLQRLTDQARIDVAFKDQRASYWHKREKRAAVSYDKQY
jgi:carbamoyltransferase